MRIDNIDIVRSTIGTRREHVNHVPHEALVDFVKVIHKACAEFRKLHFQVVWWSKDIQELLIFGECSLWSYQCLWVNQSRIVCDLRDEQVNRIVRNVYDLFGSGICSQPHLAQMPVIVFELNLT